jgi:NDP-sugar pyrophosphorylase family protein
MIDIKDFVEKLTLPFLTKIAQQPWEITNELKHNLIRYIQELNEDDYTITDGIAIHKTATIERGVVLKSPVVINENCFVGANAYFREGVFLDKNVKVGPGCEIKGSILLSNSAIAHFNYIGNSIIGKNVNFEAGSIAANHFNERIDKNIFVKYKSEIINTNSQKFGALVGDNSRIGANAVLSPGTILEKNSIVKRLELIEQI